MFTRTGAVNAYKESLQHEARYTMEREHGVRSIPLVGDVIPGFKLIGNSLYRPFKITGGFLFGHDGNTTVEAPQMPESFKGTKLEKSFNESWEHKLERSESRAASLDKLLQLDIVGWKQQKSIAEHNQAKDRKVALPDKQEGLFGMASALGTLGVTAIGSALLKAGMNAASDAAAPVIAVAPQMAYATVRSF